MYYSSKITDPSQGIDSIIKAASKFNANSFLYALLYKNWDEEKITSMCTEVKTHRGRLENEYQNLRQFALTFNKEFATNNNKCFDTALKLLNKLRSGVSETKKLFQRFCPRAHKDKFNTIDKSRTFSAFEYSLISSESYQLTIYKFDGYPECVSNLYFEMEQFFALLLQSINLCKQVIEDENTIRKDKIYCKTLFYNFCEDIISKIGDIVNIIKIDSEVFSEKNNLAIASMSQFADIETWAQHGFHNYDKKDVKILAIKQFIEQNNEYDLTLIEKALFGNDVKKVYVIRAIIQDFDSFLPDSYSREKLPADYIRKFFIYIGVKNQKLATEYFNQVYKSSPNKKHEVVKYGAINGQSSKVLKNENEYSSFVFALNSRFESTYNKNSLVVS